jgi:pyrimidine-nucleoside phosphorylase
MSVRDLIARKRDGREHTEDEVRALVEGYVAGKVPDYQMAAWLMAVRLRGLSDGETLALTLAMVESGETLDLSALGRPVADKHSTGGVGDTVTLVLAPLVAACGVPFGKMSGRGLGHTGGTLDKLEAIPGFVTELSPARFVDQLERVGVVVAGQTERMVPADRLLYALRDATATVEQQGLIASSIMSKKIATGADALVLDVKVGEGSFMPDVSAASELARSMSTLGKSVGRAVAAILTDMAHPLGKAVGNALEVREAVRVLAGEEGGQLRDVVLILAARLLVLAGAADSPTEAETRARRALETGEALERFSAWVQAQGGDPAVGEGGRGLPQAPLTVPVFPPGSGWLAEVRARPVAEACLLVGAGRETKGSTIDPAVGLVFEAELGDKVDADRPVARLHVRSEEQAANARRVLQEAFILQDMAPTPRTIILGEL